MADAMDSKSIVRKGMWVRLPPPVFFLVDVIYLRIKSGGALASFSGKGEERTLFAILVPNPNGGSNGGRSPHFDR